MSPPDNTSQWWIRDLTATVHVGTTFKWVYANDTLWGHVSRGGVAVPVSFLSAEQASQYGRYVGDTSPAQRAQFSIWTMLVLCIVAPSELAQIQRQALLLAGVDSRRLTQIPSR